MVTIFPFNLHLGAYGTSSFAKHFQIQYFVCASPQPCEGTRSYFIAEETDIDKVSKISKVIHKC